MNTPENITALRPGQIFVFGSNAAGMHAAGAAAKAVQSFGAVWGQGEGLQGQSYAIPTMEGLPALAAAVDRFLGFAGEHPELLFFVTKVGTGIAGHSVREVAACFRPRRANVILPVEFARALGGAK